jgi:plasmid stabilization system protein ParE
MSYVVTLLAKADIFDIWSYTRYPNYTVVYRPETAPLQIVAVIHGKRNMRRILKERQ